MELWTGVVTLTSLCDSLIGQGWASNLSHLHKQEISLAYFDVLLTVHYSNDQFWFQLMHHDFTLLTKSLYMFRAPTCPSSGGQTIHTPQLVQLHLLRRLYGW